MNENAPDWYFLRCAWLGVESKYGKKRSIIEIDLNKLLNFTPRPDMMIAIVWDLDESKKQIEQVELSVENDKLFYRNAYGRVWLNAEEIVIKGEKDE